MTVKIVSELTESQKQDIWALLVAADAEFVPPLSSRTQTTQTALSGGEAGASPRQYFLGLLQQSFLLTEENGRVVGFLSFRPAYRFEKNGMDFVCNYISTIIVAKSHRKQGLTSKMYGKLFEISGKTPIVTRTWSENAAHIALLHKLQFREILRIPDDRGPGIDTVYFLRAADGRFVAYCGLDCAVCEARLATVRHDEALREKVAALWSQLNGAEITPKMINCTGCRIEGAKTPYCEALCPIRKCAAKAAYDTCADCKDKQTCENLAKITANNPEARKRLE